MGAIIVLFRTRFRFRFRFNYYHRNRKETSLGNGMNERKEYRLLDRGVICTSGTSRANVDNNDLVFGISHFVSHWMPA